MRDAEGGAGVANMYRCDVKDCPWPTSVGYCTRVESRCLESQEITCVTLLGNIKAHRINVLVRL